MAFTTSPTVFSVSAGVRPLWYKLRKYSSKPEYIMYREEFNDEDLGKLWTTSAQHWNNKQASLETNKFSARNIIHDINL